MVYGNVEGGRGSTRELVKTHYENKFEMFQTIISVIHLMPHFFELVGRVLIQYKAQITYRRTNL